MTHTFALLDFSTGELLLILAILLLLFGAKKLPELSRSIGQSARELKKSASEAGELRNDVRRKVNETRNSLDGSESRRQDQRQNSDENV